MCSAGQICNARQLHPVRPTALTELRFYYAVVVAFGLNYLTVSYINTDVSAHTNGQTGYIGDRGNLTENDSAAEHSVCADIAKTIGLVTDNAGVFINPFIRFYEPDAVKSRLSAVGFVDEIDLAVGQICIGIHEKSGLLLLKKCHGYVLAVSAIYVAGTGIQSVYCEVGETDICFAVAAF